MKRRLAYLAMAVLCLSYIPTIGQTNALLEGSWTVDFQGTLDLLSDYQRARLDSLGQSALNLMEQNFSKQTFQFGSDGGYAHGNEGVVGTWSMDGNVLQIVSNASGVSVTREIISIDDEQMLLQIVPDNNANAYIHKLLLTKTQ